jgi:predicted MarR family transcription regulator
MFVIRRCFIGIKTTFRAVRIHTGAARHAPPSGNSHHLDQSNYSTERLAMKKSPSAAAKARTAAGAKAAASSPPPAARPAGKREGIVSSSHLVSPRSMELSEFEYGLIVSNNAFSRWIVHCMSAAGLSELMPLDVLLLHHVNHRARGKRLSDICFIMNVEDTHLINYSLKKLQGLGVVASTRSGKEVTYSTTAEGQRYVERYREIRESCLIDALNADDVLNRQIGDLAVLLRMLSGVYDQAARAAASL